MISLDHIGIVGSSIDELRRFWLAAGFYVTEPEELMAFDPATGERKSLGQHSCHIIFEHGYIELTAVDLVTPKHHLFPWIRSDVSVGIIAIGADDLEGVHASLLQVQTPVGSIAKASRPIHYGTRRGDALFTWFALGAASTPEALVCFVRNERPELIYQPAVQQHPNGARALESVIICAHEPDIVAARYASYAGVRQIEIERGLLQCPLQKGSVLIGTPLALRRRYGKDIDLAPGEEPRSVGFSLAPDGRVFWVPGDPAALTVLYDGACPLCRREIGVYRGLKPTQPLVFSDVSTATAVLPEGVSREELLARFHVRHPDGRLESGASAFITLWARLPGWRWLAKLGSIPGMRSVMEVIYRAFLRVRPWLQRLVILFDRRAVR